MQLCGETTKIKDYEACSFVVRPQRSKLMEHAALWWMVKPQRSKFMQLCGETTKIESVWKVSRQSGSVDEILCNGVTEWATESPSPIFQNGGFVFKIVAFSSFRIAQSGGEYAYLCEEHSIWLCEEWRAQYLAVEEHSIWLCEERSIYRCQVNGIENRVKGIGWMVSRKICPERCI